MNKYIVTTNNNSTYFIHADYFETNGEWLLFFKEYDLESRPVLVHTCSSRYIKYADLYE